MIYYSLHPFPLAATSPEGDRPYQARVRSVGTLSTEDLLTRMVERGLPGGRSAGVAALHSFFTVCQDALLDGYNLATPLFTTELSIKGTFSGPEDQFRANRHTLGFKAAPGPALTYALRHEARVRKEDRDTPHPNLVRVVDMTTDRSDALTLGGVVRLTGYRLKIGATPDEGLFLDLPDGTSVPIPKVFVNRPSELVFQLPEAGCEPGTVAQLRVRARMVNATEPRNGSLAQALTLLSPPAE